MSATVTLTIPNKAKHIADRRVLEKNHGLYMTSIAELTNIRSDLLTQQQPTAVANITLDDAVDVLNQLKQNVQMFNQKCQSTQNRIYINNGELQQLLDRITTEIAQAQATKAAADAAAAVAAAKTAAEEAAALQQAKEALQAYITSLQSQLQGINDNNTLNDIGQQIQNSANTINQYDAVLDASVSGAGEAISQATRDLIAAFKKEIEEEVLKNTQDFNALNGEFDLAKNTIVTGLNAKIQVLQGIANGANVTADAIQAALDTDKQNPIDDKNLGEIKDRAAELAATIGTKVTTEFATKKAEIEGKIEEDMASFQEKQKITEEFKKITDIFDSVDFKAKEATIQANIVIASNAQKAAVNDKGAPLAKSLANAQFGTTITELGTSIFSLETKLAPIQNLEEKLGYLQARSAKIKTPPIDVAPIQTRLVAINEAKAEYKRLSEAHQARAAELSAERKPAPPTEPRPDGLPRQSQQLAKLAKSATSEEEDINADSTSAPIEPKRTPGRRYSIFIPTPVQRKPPTSRAGAAAAHNTDNTEDTIDPNVLEIFVYEHEKESEASATGAGAVAGAGGGAGAGAGVGGGFIQRGGEPPKVAKIIKVKKITPEIKKLFLSFESPNKTLTPEFLDSIEKNKELIVVVDKPTVIDAEMKEMEKKKKEFIQSDDTTDFFQSLGKKVDHKSTIMKLMNWMTTELHSVKKYENLYEELWRFMDYADCVIILKKVISDYDNKMRSGAIKQTDTQTKKETEQKGLQQILGWTSQSTNTLYDNLLREISKCEERVTTFGSSKQELRDTGKYSKFIHKRFQGRGYRFMLNWLILIALHVYNAESGTTQKTSLLERCGEFIEKLHNVFIQWMLEIKKNNQGDLDNMFVNNKPIIVYTEKVTRLINKDIFGDSTVMHIIQKMREYMCIIDSSGERDSVHKFNITKESSSNQTQKKAVAPSSQNKTIFSSETGPETKQDEPQDETQDKTKELFIRTGRPVVPPLKVTGLTSQSGSLTDRPTKNFSSQFDLRQAMAYGRNSSVGTGSMGPLPSINDKPPFKRSVSGSVIQTPSPLPTQSPTPPNVKPNNFTALSESRRNQIREKIKDYSTGGHKRTRKHRTPASSTPTPATRRHRDYSSSSHKRTRRRRPQRREH